MSHNPYAGIRVYVVVEYRNNTPFILNFHIDPECESLKDEATNPETDELRDLIFHPDRMEQILSGEYIPERGIKKFEVLVGTENEDEFLAQDGSLHIIAPCQTCCNKPPALNKNSPTEDTNIIFDFKFDDAKMLKSVLISFPFQPEESTVYKTIEISIDSLEVLDVHFKDREVVDPSDIVEFIEFLAGLGYDKLVSTILELEKDSPPDQDQ